MCFAEAPAPYFEFPAAEGNYRVTISFGSAVTTTSTTVKAELRRLMLERVDTKIAEFVTRSFIVNVRNAEIAPDIRVKLKDREKTTEARAWDGKFTLEIGGAHPGMAALNVEAAPDVPTIYLAGDSTVADQPAEPYASWGQMLPRFFNDKVAVANHSESGESLHSFLAEGRLVKLGRLMKPGDFLLIQMGHNDQKLTGDGVGAFTTYRSELKRFITEARAHGTTPVLITSMHRRTFDTKGNITNSLGDFPEAVRRVAAEESVSLVDLNAMSKTFYEAIGPEASREAFAPGDGTHHNNYGAYELARCVIESIRQQKLPMAQFFAGDVKPFDPAQPDPMSAVLSSMGH